MPESKSEGKKRDPSKGRFADLLAEAVEKTAPTVEPLEAPAQFGWSTPASSTAADVESRQRRSDELAKIVQMNVLKAKLSSPELLRALDARPAKPLSLDIPLKATPAARPTPPGQTSPAVAKQEVLPPQETHGPPVRLPSTPEAARREEQRLKAKAEDTEAELVLKELQILAEEEATEAEQTGAPVHRRYLLRRRDEVSHSEQGVRVRLSAQTAEKEEFAQLFSDVYSQLESSKRPTSIPEQLKVPTPEKPPEPASELFAAQSGEAKPSPSIEELLKDTDSSKSAESSTTSQAAGGNPLFDQLAQIGGKPQQKANVEFVEVQASKGMGCPTCHATNARIIFCPYCATGLCANCSPKVIPQADAITYACPHCGEDVQLKKKK